MRDTPLKHCIRPYLSGKAQKFLSGDLLLVIFIQPQTSVVRGGAEMWEVSPYHVTGILQDAKQGLWVTQLQTNG